MPNHDDLLADLPAPNPDEPASLRKDIADELRDHLECAARREAVTHQDPNEIENRVLARFGDPKKIALRLWLDWMKEKLMMQKITLALVSLVAVVSLGACGLMWSLAQDFQAASAELLTQGRDANQELFKQNQAMMAKLSELSERDEALPESFEWNPLKVRVVKNDEEKSPAEGFAVTLEGHAHSASEKIKLEEKTNHEGIADFSFVRPGTYWARVDTPWGEFRPMEFIVRPGTPHVEELVCPAGPREPVSIQPVVEWPEELRDLPVAVIVRLRHAHRAERQIDKGIWYQSGAEFLMIRPDGRFASYSDAEIDFQPNFDPPRMHARPLDVKGTPKVFTESFPWHGRNVLPSLFGIVFLPREAEFPKEGETLPQLAPTDLSWHSSLFPRFKQQLNERGSDLQIIEISDDQKREELKIEISPHYVWITKAMLAAKQFPKLTPRNVELGALSFFGLDRDGDSRLSEEELAAPIEIARNEVIHLGEFLEFKEAPVAFGTFIEKYAEKLSSPDTSSIPAGIRRFSAGGGRGGSRFGSAGGRGGRFGGPMGPMGVRSINQ